MSSSGGDAPPPLPHEGYVSSPFQVNLKENIGAVTIGLWFSLPTFGVNLLSTLRYYNSFPHDPLAIRTLVGVIMAVDCMYIVAQCDILWPILIDNWGNLVVLDNTTWGWPGAIGGLGILAILVQAYFAWRVWVLSGFRAWHVAALIMLLSVVSCGFALTTMVDIIVVTHPSGWGPMRWTDVVWLCTAAAADALITGAIIYYLRKADTGYANHHKVVRHWTITALETNGLTALGALLEAILVLKWGNSGSLVYVSMAFATSQLYPLSMLTVLNSRTMLNKERHAPGSGTFNSQTYGGGLSSGPMHKHQRSFPPPAVPPTFSYQTDVELPRTSSGWSHDQKGHHHASSNSGLAERGIRIGNLGTVYVQEAEYTPPNTAPLPNSAAPLRARAPYSEHVGVATSPGRISDVHSPRSFEFYRAESTSLPPRFPEEARRGVGGGAEDMDNDPPFPTYINRV